MKIVSIVLLAFASTAAHAEVFKCTDRLGKTVYQSKPCQTIEKGRQLDIKTDPAKEAEAKAKFDALQTEYSNKKAVQIEAEKQAAEQQNQVRQIYSPAPQNNMQGIMPPPYPGSVPSAQ